MSCSRPVFQLFRSQGSRPFRISSCRTLSHLRPVHESLPTSGPCKSWLGQYGAGTPQLVSKRFVVVGSLGTRMGGGDFVDEVQVEYQEGLPVMLVPLPSRRERCQFTMKPLTHNVGDLLRFLRQEDGGIDRAIVFSKDGYRVAQSTSIDVLMRHQFKMEINDKVYNVEPPDRAVLSHEDAEKMSDVKALLSQLYSSLNLEQYQLEKEKDLLNKLEAIKMELRPLEKDKLILETKAAARTRMAMWGGLGYMGLQFGVLARLTWWEYSWDIMEPVTYFITYGTAIICYGYFLITQTDFQYPAARDRQYLKFLYKGAQKQHFDLAKYNALREQVSRCEVDLERLRDPLQLQMPMQQLEARDLERHDVKTRS